MAENLWDYNFNGGSHEFVGMDLSACDGFFVSCFFRKGNTHANDVYDQIIVTNDNGPLQNDHVISLAVAALAFSMFVHDNQNIPIGEVCKIGKIIKKKLNNQKNLYRVPKSINSDKENQELSEDSIDYLKYPKTREKIQATINSLNNALSDNDYGAIFFEKFLAGVNHFYVNKVYTKPKKHYFKAQ
ncbi:hypothetical protein DICPUDRAFT_151606 [Dictyostelium purpureum]|uniref:Uncharacterized protein n=1 Tax=Dictyostelium purpureum TaxID=5786 RepID=F0ZJ97_DICPU|nr:uncharacterized protein DICPUDRAFT_151606 [Dictyostelium purpureum]EGC35980.1 hypothetical protein DICPUDRAFT_151606 [Dictyostelium purpureum]|eukprot:XP_003287481.1 hypothetical protein DICPUDRAFT_151606 [Dictyostelium purpureum]